MSFKTSLQQLIPRTCLFGVTRHLLSKISFYWSLKHVYREFVLCLSVVHKVVMPNIPCRRVLFFTNSGVVTVFIVLVPSCNN